MTSSWPALGLALLAAAAPAAGGAFAGEGPASPVGSASLAGGTLGGDPPPGPGCSLDPEVVELRPTQNAPAGRGRMTLMPADSPYGVAVDATGRQVYEIVLEVDRLRRRPGASWVAWAATPELDRVARLGILADSARVRGRVAWNKFLVFVSEEPDPGVERWTGPILLTGLSPSGRMHTMAGHGPFEDVNCADFF